MPQIKDKLFEVGVEYVDIHEDMVEHTVHFKITGGDILKIAEIIYENHMGNGLIGSTIIKLQEWYFPVKFDYIAI